MGHWSISQLDVGNYLYHLGETGTIDEYRVVSKGENGMLAILNLRWAKISFVGWGDIDLSDDNWFGDKEAVERAAKALESRSE